MLFLEAYVIKVKKIAIIFFKLFSILIKWKFEINLFSMKKRVNLHIFIYIKNEWKKKHLNIHINFDSKESHVVMNKIFFFFFLDLQP